MQKKWYDGRENTQVTCGNHSEPAGLPLGPLVFCLFLNPTPFSHASSPYNSFSIPSSLPPFLLSLSPSLALSLWDSPSLPCVLWAADTAGEGTTYWELGGPGKVLANPQRNVWGSCLEAGRSSFSVMRNPRPCEGLWGSEDRVPTHPSAPSGQMMALVHAAQPMVWTDCLCPPSPKCVC